MRILLDGQLPRKLRHLLPGHIVRTARQQGWAGLRNGDLLRRTAGAGFDVFVTADRGLQFQQNLAGSSLRIIVVIARSTRLQDLLPLIPLMLQAIQQAQSGEVRQVPKP